MPVNIQVTAETAQAAKAFTAFTTQASAGLKQLENSGQRAANAMAFVPASMGKMDDAGKKSAAAQNALKLGLSGSKDALQGLRSAALTVGLTTMPQLTQGVMAANGGFKVVTASMKLFGLGAGPVGVAVASLTAIVAAGAAAVSLYREKWDAVRSAQALARQNSDIGQRYGELIVRGQDAGKITDADADKLFAKLASTDPNKLKEVAQALREIGIDKDRAAAMEKLLQMQDNLRVNALAGFAKERAEAVQTKTDRLQAIDDELAKFKTFAALRAALVDEGRAHEIAGMTTVAEFRKSLTDLADAEFQTRMEAVAVAEDKDRETRSRAVEAEMIKLHKIKDDALKEETELVRRYQKIQEDEDQEVLRRWEERRAENIQRIQASQFLTDAQKFNQSKAAGADMSGQADPSSMFQQMSAGLASIKSQWGTLQQQIAEGFYGTINNSVNLVSDGLTSLIFKTDGWREKLAQIPMQILQGIVGAIIQMGVRTVASMVMTAVAGKALAAASTAALIPIASAQSAIWAAPAALSLVATYGGSAALVSAIPGVIASGKALALVSSAGFKDGGFTGPGANTAVAGVVHRNEYVMPAEATSRIGVRNLELMRKGATPAAASGGGTTVNQPIAVFFDRTMLDQYLRDNSEAIVVNAMKKNRVELGFQT